MEVTAKHVPAARARLLSPQMHFEEHKQTKGKHKGQLTIDCEGGLFVFPEGDGQLSFSFNEDFKLPIGHGYSVSPKEICTRLYK